MDSNTQIRLLESFDKEKAYKKEINDGFIKCIYLEDDNWDSTVGVSEDNTDIGLQTAGNALIEFANGKHILVHNSEWCSLSII